MRSAERLTPVLTHHGEGPFWDSRTDRFLCLDVFASAVVEIDLAGGHRRHLVPSRAATVIRRRTSGGFVVAIERGILTTDERFQSFEPLTSLSDEACLRTNDGGCDPLGAFVIGTMSYDERTGAGAVYRIAPDRTVTTLVSPVSISNGVQWSDDGERVFYVDTPTLRVDAFDVDAASGAWSGRRTHIHIDRGLGFPDGMAIDEAGGLWIALWGGGAIVHYDGSGRYVETVAVPGVSQVSSCAFGGEDRSTLFITTSRKGIPEGKEPDAGAIFAVQTSVRGSLQSEFAG